MTTTSIKYQTITDQQTEALYTCMKQLDLETQFMLYQPEERVYDEAKLAQRIDGAGVIIGAFVADQIIGYIQINRSNLAKVKHCGYIVLGVLAQYAGHGIGTSLIQRAIAWSQANAIHRLELTVISNNKIARQLYEKNALPLKACARILFIWTIIIMMSITCASYCELILKIAQFR